MPDDTVSLLWPIQVDESADFSGKVQRLTFIRFKKNKKCVNEYLFCKDLQTTTKGENIFVVLNENILLLKLLHSGKTMSVYAPIGALPCREVEKNLSLLWLKKIQMCLLFTA